MRANERELRSSSRTDQLIRAAREVVLEKQIEAGDHRGERDPDHDHDGHEKTSADASWQRNPAHRSA